MIAAGDDLGDELADLRHPSGALNESTIFISSQTGDRVEEMVRSKGLRKGMPVG